MTLFNNTKSEKIYYSISHKGGVDCGNLDPGDQAELSSYDDKPDVKLTLSFLKTGDETEVVISDPGL
jgi:hypothetical protein